jgi:vacuolar-type H+-ATPase subunit I/STV1
MKKVLILLLGVAVVASSCGRANKKAQMEQARLERIKMQQDSARRADEERILELQMKARQDSIAMAMAMSSLSTTSTAESSAPSAYYVVIGSFLSKANARNYLSEQQETFSDAEIVTSGRWNYVCVGGSFRSFSAAARTLDDVKSQLGGGGGEDEEYSDEEGGGEEEMAEEDVAAEEEYAEEEESFEEEESYADEEGGGQAWVMGI